MQIKVPALPGRYCCAGNATACYRRGGDIIRTAFVWAALLSTVGVIAASRVDAAPCLDVILTGTGGPPPFAGLAGPGTLVRYGDDANDCSDVILQFDAGRGTTMRLSQLGLVSSQLDAVFFTHIHSDHVEGFSDIVQMRWLFGGDDARLDVVCSADAPSPTGVDVSCRTFVAHIDDAYELSGETAQRAAEGGLDPVGPVPGINIVTFEPTGDARVVWSSGDVKVSAIRSNHIPGHASFRVDTPAGSVVIGGDAVNDAIEPPRRTSTSDAVEKLAEGVDVIVHSAIHPVLAPEAGSGMPPVVYYRQSNATDLGAMAERVGAGHLMLTHLGPSLGAEAQGPWKIPGGALTEEDYRKAVAASGYRGDVIVGTDLARLRLPAK
jgi:ribonuclease Z